jgi:deaminated glutathione amidase
LKIALIQTCTPATHAAALDHLVPLVRQAVAGGARLIVTPECSNVMQRDRARLLPALQTVDEDVVVQALRALAAECEVEILIGSALVRDQDGTAVNRSILLRADGTVAATYDKIHMFDVDLPTGERIRESEAYRPGDRAVVVDSVAGPLGLTICYDLRFPLLYRGLAKAGAGIMTIPAAFTRPTGEAHWEVLLRARAIETGSFVLAPAQGGLHEDGRGTWGRSLVIAPWGDVVARLDHDMPGVLFAEIDLAQVDRARSAIPSLANERMFAAPTAQSAEASDVAGAAE